jgi:hydrogenase nickel incorporation protein HypA/HybF
MHELSICLALLDKVQSIAATHSAAEVERILLRVGPLSGIEPPLLKTAFSLASAGTIAESAVLDIELTEVRVWCQACALETAAAPNRLVCGRCGGFRTEVTGGEEMLLASLELRVADQHAEG